MVSFLVPGIFSPIIFMVEKCVYFDISIFFHFFKGTYDLAHFSNLAENFSFLFYRYFETMLTMFDESNKSEVELKDIVDSQIMALSLHFLYNNNLVPLKRKNVHDILQLAIYLQIQSLQGICCKYLQVSTF